MFLSRHQNEGQYHTITAANRIFGNVAPFRYLDMKITNQNLSREEMKRKLNSGNVCYHSVQKPSHLLSKIVKIRIYKIIFFPVVLYGCEALSLTLNEKHRLRGFEKRMLRRIL
jgi:hypothetical protein